MSGPTLTPALKGRETALLNQFGGLITAALHDYAPCQVSRTWRPLMESPLHLWVSSDPGRLAQVEVLFKRELGPVPDGKTALTATYEERGLQLGDLRVSVTAEVHPSVGRATRRFAPKSDERGWRLALERAVAFAEREVSRIDTALGERARRVSERKALDQRVKAAWESTGHKGQTSIWWSPYTDKPTGRVSIELSVEAFDAVVAALTPPPKGRRS